VAGVEFSGVGWERENAQQDERHCERGTEALLGLSQVIEKICACIVTFVVRQDYRATYPICSAVFEEVEGARCGDDGELAEQRRVDTVSGRA
jgi:hypothetical protein